MDKPILIYTEKHTPRLEYIVSVLYNDKAQISSSLDELLSFQGITINYSGTHSPNDAVWIIPHGLLSETGVQEQDIVFGEWKRMKMFFPTAGELPFDIFAAAFYLLSRYEEYLPFDADEYGRFPHTASLAYRENFLQQPLVSQWMKQFDLYLGGRFPYVPFSGPQVFRWIPTYDIDIAYHYHGQPLWKNVWQFFRQLVAGNYESVAERSHVYSGRKKDPFDVYEWLDELHAGYNLSPVYFFLLAERQRGYDKNISPRRKHFQRLIRHHAKKYRVGIHPSWQSGDDSKKLQKEIGWLEKITGQKTLLSRQHYLRMRLPDTYRLLIDAGIEEDHSLGYGQVNGFRASYAQPLAWYDLPAEKATSLVLHPFCFMDSNAIFHQRENADEAMKELEELYRIVKDVKGEMITIFHNHFLTEQEEWKEWRMMYARFVNSR